ncbi:MAG: hypothetical protein ABSH56_03580 [Bryobacteraceae bacterium]|jgi:anti-anti-sigma regulatory factor
MLRIISSRETGSQDWMLCGQLAGAWVTELHEQWVRRRRESPDLLRLLDLSDVTFIDEAGARLLREMRSEGVRFVAKGVETRHLVENLEKLERPELRRFFGQPRDRGC